MSAEACDLWTVKRSMEWLFHVLKDTRVGLGFPTGDKDEGKVIGQKALLRLQDRS